MSGQDRPPPSDPALPLAGRAVLVAGSGGGLAESIACASAERGARVALVTSEGGQLHPQVTVFRAPLETDADLDEIFEVLPLQLPRLETVIVVVAAEPFGFAHQVSLDDWRQRVERPLRSTFSLVSRAVEELLAEGAAGRFVIVIEPPAAGVEPDEVVENALRSFVRSFAREYGRRGFACNLVSARGNGRSGENPFASIVEHALYLASPGASFINGDWLVTGPVRASP